MENQKIKKTSLKKIFFTLVFVFSISFFPTQKAQAWDAVLGAIADNAIFWMADMIKGILVGALKQAAVTTLTKAMSNLIGGGSGSGPMFITDWQDYLIKQPARNTQLYMNSYLTQMTRGQGSIASYVPNKAFEGTGPGSFNTGMSQYGNYFSRLVANAEQSSVTRTASPPTYQGDPSQMFAKGNMIDLSRYNSGNNSQPAFIWNGIADEMWSLEEERDVYMAKAIAGGGFTGKEVDGQTVTPGSLVKESMANSEDIGNNILAGAQTTTSIMTAVVSKLVTQSIQNGIGKVQARVQKEITDVQNRSNEQIQNAINTSGPGALYKRN